MSPTSLFCRTLPRLIVLTVIGAAAYYTTRSLLGDPPIGFEASGDVHLEDVGCLVPQPGIRFVRIAGGPGVSVRIGDAAAVLWWSG